VLSWPEYCPVVVNTAVFVALTAGADALNTTGAKSVVYDCLVDTVCMMKCKAKQCG